jgi:hypothetical protein
VSCITVVTNESLPSTVRLVPVSVGVTAPSISRWPSPRTLISRNDPRPVFRGVTFENVTLA